METKKFKLLIDVHVQHLIWKNELELAQMELGFWEKLLTTLEEQEPSIHDEVIKEVSQLNHFQRLSQVLLNEVQEVDKRVAEGVQRNQVLDQQVRANHKYLREQMDAFHSNYQSFKDNIRQFVVAQPQF
ncbi:hypothetical protein [Telluribacter humicola]|uniref:hypothetical protein n=1 Tax=Telluribacter humicola TaxID=1720261 RepID=UPI001A97A6C6|nr:hypothetical protein [Telluribacter humicola]